MIRKALSSLGIGAASLLVLTGCNPPMPESLKVELAERTVQCGEAFVEAKVFPEMVDVADFWNSSMDVACKGCTPYANVPLAVDAAVISFYFEEIYELNLSPRTIAGIFNGSITNWSDAAIQDINPNLELPDLEIVVNTAAPGLAISAMEKWLSAELGETVELSLLEASEGSEVDALYLLGEGEIKLTSFASLQISGMGYANMILDESNLDAVLLPEVLSIQTGIGQTVVSGEAPNLSFDYDPSIPAEPLPGQFEAIEPWGALYPVTLSLCGADDLQVRFAARYLLRLDAQGAISTGVFSPLKEEVRVAAISVVDDGLPEVEIPADLELEQ
jgi:phosphate transport system substrate-binding protein